MTTRLKRQWLLLGRRRQLERFVRAQDFVDGFHVVGLNHPGPAYRSMSVYEVALMELRAGRKQSHWMWFIFPQESGLGKSFRSRYYAVGSVGEAKAYLAHPVLGPRLRECTEAVLPFLPDHRLESRRPMSKLVMVFGTTDAQKFLSSMGLFAYAAESLGEAEHWPFATALALEEANRQRRDDDGQP